MPIIGLRNELWPDLGDGVMLGRRILAMIKSPVSKKEGYAMKEDTVVSFRQPGSFLADPLTDVLRSGARRLLAQAVEADVEAHILSPIRI